MIADAVESNGILVLDGVHIIHAVDLGGLKQTVRADLAGAQSGRSIGGEIGVTRTGGEDDDVALLKAAHRATADVGFADLVHLDTAHDAAGAVDALDGVLQGESVHDRGEHAHVVGLGALHTLGGTCDTTEDVAAADDDGDLNALVMQLLDLGGHALDDSGIDAVIGAAHQRLAGNLEKNAFVLVIGQGCLLSTELFPF